MNSRQLKIYGFAFVVALFGIVFGFVFIVEVFLIFGHMTSAFFKSIHIPEATLKLCPPIGFVWG